MKQHDTKLWITKVHQNVMNENNIREKIIQENDDLRDALEWIVDVFTQSDDRWNDVPCISRAKELLYK